MEDRKYFETKEEKYIRECKEWIARRKARLDQFDKLFDDQYSMFPRKNLLRLDDLEAWKFEIEINEWELGEFIESLESQGGDDEAPSC